MIMGSIIKIIRRFKWRLLSQVTALGALNAYFFRIHSVCSPVLNCHGCPAAILACPVGLLVNFSSLRLFPFITVGILGLVGVTTGRLVCGWLCPFGFLQDAIYRIRTKKISLPPVFRYTKYFVLFGLVLMIPFFFPESKFTFCRVCPAGTLESSIPWRIMGLSSGDSIGFFIRISVLLGVLILVVIVNRGFCLVLCPLGAIFSIFNRFSLFRLRVNQDQGNSHGLSAKMCPVKIDPIKEINSPECIRCLKCTFTRHLKLGIK
jgi:ferredoxin-type protein NapH